MASTKQAAPRQVITLAEGHTIEIDGPEVRYYTSQRILWAYAGENREKVWISLHLFDGQTLKPISEQNFITVVDKRAAKRASRKATG